jgi:hypothetical protein
MSRYRSLNRTRRRAFANPNFPAGTPTYAGDLALPFIAPAVKSGDTLANNYVRTIDGITNKAVIQGVSISDVGENTFLQAAGCDFEDANSVTLTESVLTLSDLKVNESLCRASLLPSWVSQRGARATADWGSPEIRNFVLEQVAAKTAEGVENLIWKGGAVGGAGFLSNDGTFDAAGLAASSLAGATIQAITSMDSDNVVAQLGLVYQKAAADKAGILNKPDLKFFVSNKTAALYRQALATAGGAVSHDGSTTVTSTGTGYNAQVTNQAFTALNFLGIQIAECPGMFDDVIVLAQTENLVVGSNLMTDFSTVQYIPAFQYDGSDNVKVVMQFGLGTVAGIQADAIVGHVAF